MVVLLFTNVVWLAVMYIADVVLSTQIWQGVFTLIWWKLVPVKFGVFTLLNVVVVVVVSEVFLLADVGFAIPFLVFPFVILFFVLKSCTVDALICYIPVLL